MQREVARKRVLLFISLLTSGRPRDTEQKLAFSSGTLSHVQGTNPEGPTNRKNCEWGEL